MRKEFYWQPVNQLMANIKETQTAIKQFFFRFRDL